MKLIVAGGRDVTDKDFIDRAFKESGIDPDEITEIVLGGAKGVDSLAEEYFFNRYKLSIFPADWETKGKAAGPIRNAQMADYADSLIAIWDGESRGTQNMINQMVKRGKSFYIYYVARGKTAP